MKTPLFMLTAAALSLVAAAAQASPREVKDFLERAQTEAEARVAAAKIALGAQGVQVSGSVSTEGRLYGVHVIGTSGSRDTDAAVEQALARLQLDGVPPVLGGAKVTLSLHPSAMVQAQAH